MRIAVLGAGVIGVTAAWYLARDGHEVTVVDRQPGAALETSFANGGQISASHAEPLANPTVLRKIVKWLGRPDAPLRFRPTADLQQWRWCLQFLRECSRVRTKYNTLQCLKLALYSRDCLRSLRAATGIAYEYSERGILQLYTDAKEFDEAIADAALMRDYGCDRDVKSVEQCVVLEPALASCRQRLVGGIYTATDESGDAHSFTQELARLAAHSGVVFRWGTGVEALVVDTTNVRGVRCRAGPDRRRETIEADAYVVALGSYSPLLLEPIGVPCLVYPAKGYSATILVGGHRGAPTLSLTDIERRLVFSRFGDRLRVAGMLELGGYGKELDRVRCDSITARTFALFPDAGERESIRYWTGLRPATPSNVPLIGGTRYRNLFLDTGHGTLGWTMACGSGRLLADVIAGGRTAIDFAFTPTAH